MQNSSNANDSGNPGNPDKRVRRHIKHVELIETLNRGKVDNWQTSDDSSEFRTVRWGNVQIDPLQVRVGDDLLLALKEEVLIGSHRNRLIARYGTMTVRSPELCVEEDLWHAMSICTECIRDSWPWDYLIRNVRTLRNFAHGTARAYDYFGCRCDACALGHSRYLKGLLNHEDHTYDYDPSYGRILA